MATLGLAYLAAIGGMGTWIWAAYHGLTPTFYIPDAGYTAVRHPVLWLGVLTFAASSLWYARLSVRTGRRFAKWFSQGLAIITVAMVGAVLISGGGTTMAWLARATQCVGGIYMLVAISCVVQDSSTWRIQLERALKESEDRFRVMADRSPLMIWATDSQGVIEFVNQEYLHFFGTTLQALRSEGWQPLVHPDDDEDYTGAFVRALRDHQPFCAEARVRRHDEQWRWVISYGTPRFSSDGEFLGMIGSSPDITDRKRAEEEVHRAKQQLQNTMDSITDGLLVMDRDWRYTYFSKKAAEIIAVRQEDMLGGVIWDLFPHAKGTRFYEFYHRAMETGEPQHFEEFYPEPLNQWLECHCYPSKEGLTVYFRDVTDRKQAEEKLRKENAEIAQANRIIRAFVEHDGDELFDRALAIVQEGMASRHGVFGYIGTPGHLTCPSLSKMLDECEIEGKCIHYPPEKWKGLWARALKKQRSLYTNETARVPPGHPTIYNNLATPILFRGEAIGLLNLANKDGGYTDEDRDMLDGIAARIAPILYAWIQRKLREDERQAAEAALRELNTKLEQRVSERTAELQARAQQLARLTSELTMAEQRERQHLAQVLHDGLQQLLVAARFRLNVLEMSPDPALKKEAEELGELISDSIETSRSLTAELSPPVLKSGLMPSLEWLVRWMEDKHGLSVDLDAPRQVGISAENVTVLLFQATRELLFNVVKHAGVKAARVEAQWRDSEVAVSVVDQGRGFDPQRSLPNDKQEGGLGLFAIRERVELMGGEMKVDSAVGRGTRMTLVVPVAAAVPDAAEGVTPRAAVSFSLASAETAATSTGGQLRIALVDDHAVVRQGLATLLRQDKRFQVVGEASDGKSAVELVGRLLPDVVLMDISMPGMNGIEATKIIHDEHPEVCVIGLSMHDDAHAGEQIRQAGASAYLSKSGPVDAIVQAIMAYRVEATP